MACLLACYLAYAVTGDNTPVSGVLMNAVSSVKQALGMGDKTIKLVPQPTKNFAHKAPRKAGETDNLGSRYSYYNSGNVYLVGYNRAGTFGVGRTFRLAPYSLVTAVEVPFEDVTNISDVSVTVASVDLTPLATKHIEEPVAGWNLVLLDDPVTVPANGDFFVYYEFTVNQIDTDNDLRPMFVCPTDQEYVGSFYVRDITDGDENWYDNSYMDGSYYGTLLGVYAVSPNLVVYNDNFEDWTSSNHDDSTTDSHSWTIDCSMPSTTLSFDYAVSSESGCDVLEVMLDDEVVINVSGEQTGTFTREFANEGTHTLTAQYRKDGSVNNGKDEASIQHIQLSAVQLSDDMLASIVANTMSQLTSECEAFAGYDAIAAQLQEALSAIDTENAVSDYAGFTAEVAAFRNLLRQAYDVKDLYEALCESINIGKELNATAANDELGTALTNAEALAAAQATLTLESYDNLYAASDALDTAIALYQSNQVAMEDWAFSSNAYTINGLRYYLDTTHHLAEFIGFNTYDVNINTLDIPAAVRYNGTTYAVVAMINNNRYSQSIITEVKLPKSLRYIGDYGLGYFSSLRSVEIPENVTAMGNYVFSNSSNLTSIKMNAVVPPTIGSMSGSSYKKITIPVESFHAYRIANVWKDNVLIGGDGVTVSTGKIAAGDLGHIILDEATYLQEVNKLIIDEGTLNNDDWNSIKSMTNLIEIDMSGVSCTNIPSSAFYDRWAIEKIVLPHNVSTIGSSAFYNAGIKEIVLPETLTTIGDRAFNYCNSLQRITIPNGITTIPSYCFSDCTQLQQVVLPEGLLTVGNYAFNSCSALSEVNLPATLQSIGGYAFRYCPIKDIEIPAGIQSIGNYTFANNPVVENLVIPATVTTIGTYAFQYCSALQHVELSEGLVEIGSRAFQSCSSLTEIVLPSSLEKCESAPFYGCSGIKKIEARSVIPPTTGGTCPLSGANLSDVTLFVPSWSTSEYPLTPGWSEFYTFEVSDFMPQYIKVNKDFYFTVKDDFAADYRPNISMTYSNVESTDAYGYYNYERGNLTVSGRSKLAVNDFSFVVSPYAKYYADENVARGYSYDNYRTNLNSTSLIVNGEMRAENVRMILNNMDDRWQFVTFPFDVKVSDIVPQKESTSWVIRGHNGAMRAAGQNDAVWENLTADDVLEAGKGYIMHNYTPGQNYWSDGYTMFDVTPLKESVNRQYLFSSEDRTIELEENLAEFDHNRSWNLIGNPYPSFYDTRFMDFDAPFMVWNSYNQNYVAYNPADDAYILSPGEAFFVQRPFEQEAITFRKEGRQNHRYAREMEMDMPARAKVQAAEHRSIFNVKIEQGELSDRTRIVMNDAATLDYEISRDAAKFASTEKTVPQIFTFAGKSRYAINERPFDNGDVALGIYCGTAGEYTLSIDKTNDCKVILEDTLTGVFVELTAEKAYTFSAIAGENLTRFVLHFTNTTTGVSNINSDNNGNEAIYNLHGIKVNNTKAGGIFIKNSQKTTIK